MAERQAELQKLQKERQKGGGTGASGTTGGAAMRDVTPESKKKRPPRTGG
jgi:hypothetical protein